MFTVATVIAVAAVAAVFVLAWRKLTDNGKVRGTSTALLLVGLILFVVIALPAATIFLLGKARDFESPISGESGLGFMLVFIAVSAIFAIPVAVFGAVRFAYRRLRRRR